MTGEQWEKLRPYSEEKNRRQEIFNNHMILNMPTDPRKKIEASIAYDRAYAEWQEACRAYSKAMREVLGEG